jgi:hypothetical protein
LQGVILPRHHLRKIARVLVWAFLIARLGAEAHAYSHVVDSQAGIPGTAQHCDTCLSIAPLLVAAGGSQPVLLTRRSEFPDVLAVESFSVSLAPSRRAFQPRAPPPLL